MKPIILDQASTSTLYPLVKSLPKEATHFRIVKKNGKRPTFEEVEEHVEEHKAGDSILAVQGEVSVTPAHKVKGKWIELEWKKQPRAQTKTKPKTKLKSTSPTNTGFVADIRKLLHSGKYTVASACEKLLEKFPAKTAKSVKRICYNVAKKEGVKWRTAAVNTGYLNRIDELIDSGDYTSRQIGEVVSAEYEKDVKSAKAVVRARIQVRKGLGQELNVPLENAESRLVSYVEEEA